MRHIIFVRPRGVVRRARAFSLIPGEPRRMLLLGVGRRLPARNRSIDDA